MTPTWVVYVFPVAGQPDCPKAVCRQDEWEALERDRPGVFTLFQAGLTTEAVAERLARGTAGSTRQRLPRLSLFGRRRDEDTTAVLSKRAA
jgi:hypothetical protein